MAVGESPSRIARRCICQWLNAQSTRQGAFCRSVRMGNSCSRPWSNYQARSRGPAVDVISTDRHTVKPWFQGRLPFAFNLPDLQNSELSLRGGRMTYLEQTSGAHLITMCGSTIFPCSCYRNDHCLASWRIRSLRRTCRSTWKHGVKAGFAIS
jgi:hypothetical protein